jgi:hypothetical protein
MKVVRPIGGSKEKDLFRAIIVFFITESGTVRKDGSIFLQNISICLQDHMVSPPIKPHSPSTTYTTKTLRDLMFLWHIRMMDFLS